MGGLSNQPDDCLALATSGFLGTWAAYKYWVPRFCSQPSRNWGCPGNWERPSHLHQTPEQLPDSLQMRGTQARAWHEPCGVDCVQAPNKCVAALESGLPGHLSTSPPCVVRGTLGSL